MNTPNENEPSKLRKILTSEQDESIMSRLPRGNGAKPSTPARADIPPTLAETALVPVPAPTYRQEEKEPPAEKKSTGWRFKFMPAFWTIASVISLTVNLVLLIVVLMLWQNRAPVGAIANSQVGPLLGG